jgi:hypothetical protein
VGRPAVNGSLEAPKGEATSVLARPRRGSHGPSSGVSFPDSCQRSSQKIVLYSVLILKPFSHSLQPAISKHNETATKTDRRFMRLTPPRNTAAVIGRTTQAAGDGWRSGEANTTELNRERGSYAAPHGAIGIAKTPVMACQSARYAPPLGHGLFTYAVAEGLDGKGALVPPDATAHRVIRACHTCKQFRR